MFVVLYAQEFADTKIMNFVARRLGMQVGNEFHGVQACMHMWMTQSMILV